MALGIEYDGHEFHGWQAQENLTTIQESVEKALAKIANTSVKLICAGRTDAGVHAIGQVVHFDTATVRSLRAWVQGTNAYLPKTIAVRFAKEVDEKFHARFSAISRCYRYVIYNNTMRSAVWAQRAMWRSLPLDIDAMQRAGHFLVGEHDFTSFRSSDCEAKSPMRNIQSLAVIRLQDFIFIDIQANAFLHHMVRNIVGVLLRVGGGLARPDWVRDVLVARDRRAAAITAPATGLYLTKVNYPEPYLFPQPNYFMLSF